MSGVGRSEYDRDVGTWSPEGRLFQIEYAIEAIKLGNTAIGVSTKEGVLLCAGWGVTVFFRRRSAELFFSVGKMPFEMAG